jgi:hypothetical protein
VFVWEYERASAFDPGPVEYRHNPWRASVKAAGAQTDLYADPKPDGTVDYETYENILEKLEKPANTIFQKLRGRKSITSAEKAIFASYIGVMLKRVPARENRAAAIWPQLVNRTDWEALITAAERGGHKNAREEVERVKKEFEHGMPREIALKSMVMPYERVLEAFGTMSWKLFVAPTGTAFATSDNPVFFPEDKGIGDEKAVLVFPISSEVAIVASWQGAKDCVYIKATKRRVQQINLHVLHNASALGYYHVADERVQKLLGSAA